MKLRTLLVFTATFLITTHSSPCTNTATQETQRKTDAHVPSFKLFDYGMWIASMTPPFVINLFSSHLFIHFLASKTDSSTYESWCRKIKNNSKLNSQESVLYVGLVLSTLALSYINYSLVDRPLSRVHETYTYLKTSQKYYRYKEDNKESLPEYITATSPIMSDLILIKPEGKNRSHKELYALLQPLAAHHKFSKDDEGWQSGLQKLIPECVTNTAKEGLKFIVDINQINHAYELQMKNEQDAVSEILKRGTSKN